jgi:hypothetical protein
MRWIQCLPVREGSWGPPPQVLIASWLLFWGAMASAETGPSESKARPANVSASGPLAVGAMPPTNLRVEITASATQLTNTIFAREGVPEMIRALVISSLHSLMNEDLTFLSKGNDPETVGLEKPGAISDDQWRRLVPAFAEATLDDRRRRAEFKMQLTIGVLIALLSLPLGVIGGVWLERRKENRSPLPAAVNSTRPTSAAPGPVKKKGRRKRGR